MNQNERTLMSNRWHAWQSACIGLHQLAAGTPGVKGALGRDARQGVDLATASPATLAVYAAWKQVRDARAALIDAWPDRRRRVQAAADASHRAHARLRREQIARLDLRAAAHARRNHHR